jgi:hypothetical protein
VHFGGRPSPNLFAAGEVMAGNVLGQGYTAGVGMTIGTVFGRIAGTSAGRRGARGAGRPHAPLEPRAWAMAGRPARPKAEVARVLQICNACRYCEGFCAVFPAMTRRLEFNKPPTCTTWPTCATTAAPACTPASTRRRTSLRQRAAGDGAVRAPDLHAGYAWPRPWARCTSATAWCWRWRWRPGLALFLVLAAAAGRLWRCPRAAVLRCSRTA